MSFATDIKSEITKLDSNHTEYIAELSAFIRNNAYIGNNIIKIHTENAAVARRIFKIIKDIYHIYCQVTVRSNFNFKKNFIYLLEIKGNCDSFLEDLSIKNRDGYFINIPRDYIISDDEEKRAYLRGIFLACGSVNNPKTSRYHLELLIDDNEYADFINNILNEYNLNSRVIKRVRGYMVYIKEAEKISDFLRLIKAYKGVLYYENIRIYRNQKNITNRLNNCEQANVERMINTALKQIADINLIKKNISLEILNDKLRIAAIYRLKYPETSLSELSNIITEKEGQVITKSGLNHRFRKIKILADNIREKEEKGVYNNE
ncbi:MAG: DNA-binding protein WhiA [Bacilli bacterium]|jgi:hypothetical protein|nr:DNA-binding protein WhiA [Bacilli bacterium]